jgi:hypothetical protein
MFVLEKNKCVKEVTNDTFLAIDQKMTRITLARSWRWQKTFCTLLFMSTFASVNSKGMEYLLQISLDGTVYTLIYNSYDNYAMH